MIKNRMITKQYFRIHIEDCAYRTGLPVGLFVAVWRLVEQERLTEEETALYWQNRGWFEEHLPIPPFYEDGNSAGAITWYKNGPEGLGMVRRMAFYFEMADKYGLQLYLTQTDSIPGELLYEDAFQIGVKDSFHVGDGIVTHLYNS